MPKIPSLVTVQRPRISLMTFEPVVSDKKAAKMVRSMVENPDYRVFKQLKNRANASDIRMNIKVAESNGNPLNGMLEVQMADASIPTSIEAAKIVSKIFKGKVKHLKANFKDAFETIKTVLNTDKKGGVKSVFIDPKTPFSSKVAKALDDLIVDREMSKHV